MSAIFEEHRTFGPRRPPYLRLDGRLPHFQWIPPRRAEFFSVEFGFLISSTSSNGVPYLELVFVPFVHSFPSLQSFIGGNSFFGKQFVVMSVFLL